MTAIAWRPACLGALLAAWLPLAAAPLDALLTAMPERGASTGTLELGVSRLNRALEFSTSNDTADTPPAKPPGEGDYRSQHLLGKVRVAEGAWLTAGLWQRTIDDGTDSFRYLGWQLSGQYRISEAAGALPALAIRLSAWGNRSNVTDSRTPVKVQGAVLDSVRITSPSDRQWQADLLGTWPAGPAMDVSVLAGVGQTRLSYGSLAATTRRNGCRYDLAFNGNDIFGTLIDPCVSTTGVIRQFYDSSGDYGVDVGPEIAWHGWYAQAGVNVAWFQGPWTLRGGFLVHGVQRDGVDDILARRDDPVHRMVRVVSLEAGWRMLPGVNLVLRTELGSKLFFNDLPVTYNSSTSGSFGRRYALTTVAVQAAF